MNAPGSLTRNLAWLYGGDVVAKLVTLAAFVFLMRTLGKARYGDLEFAMAVWFVLNLAQEAGLGPYGSREAAKRPAETTRLTGAVIVLRATLVALNLSMLAALVIAMSTDALWRPAEARWVVALYGLVLIPGPFVLNWVFQSRDEMSVVAGSSILRQGVLALGVFTFVRKELDGYLVPLFDAAGLAAVALVHQKLFRNRVGRIHFRGAPARARRVLGDALPLAASSFAWALRMYAPVFALYLFRDASATGVFGVGHRLVLAGHSFAWLYFFNLLPALSRAAMQRDRDAYRRLIQTSVRGVSWIVLPGCLALTALAPWLIPGLAGAAFADGVEPFRVQIWMLAAAFLSGHMRYALVAFDRQREDFLSNLAGTLVGLLALGLLGGLQHLTPLTAAIAFTASEASTLLVANALLSRGVEPIGLWRHCSRPAVVTALSGALVGATLWGHPWLAALTVVVSCAVGLLAIDRGLLRELLPALRTRIP